MSISDRFLSLFSKDLAMDLGTANTLIYMKKETRLRIAQFVGAAARGIGEPDGASPGADPAAFASGGSEDQDLPQQPRRCEGTAFPVRR